LTGTDLVIWGAVTTEKFFFEPLASIMLIPMPRASGRTALEDKMLEVANVLRALKEGAKELKDHYSGLVRPLPVRYTDRAVGYRLVRVPTPELFTETPTDYISGMFPRWRKFVSESKEYKLHYLRRLRKNLRNPIFLAKMTGGDDSEAEQTVVVKFAHRYCPEAHKLLEKERLAPRLYYANFEACAEDKPDAPDMWVVVMEYMEGATDPPDRLEEKQEEKLTKCVDVLHEAGYVHGDLRWQNILVRNDDLFLLDFDWANKQGIATYPVNVNLGEEKNWHHEVCRGGHIEFEHDLYRLEEMLAGEL
jgi:predicted Ser/Thr protein kinase